MVLLGKMFDEVGQIFRARLWDPVQDVMMTKYIGEGVMLMGGSLNLL